MLKRILLSVGVLSALFILILGVLLYQGILLFNHPSEHDYPVRGVDVSSYQGEIDWDILSGEGIQFAFIKATEGSGFVDPYFERNLSGALGTPLRVGAYHFFSYDSSGAVQAEHFIAAVPKWEGMLPPVIDVEFYGDKERHPPDQTEVAVNLGEMIDRLTEYYGMAPILYATEKSYRLYIADGFADCDIWIRNILSRPSLSDGRSWIFWQYANRGRLRGYTGREKFIDLNVFLGTQAEFDAYGM